MINRIAQILNLKPKSVESVIELFEGGATIPFIARYRKEATGSLDEVEIMNIFEEWERQKDVLKRQESILKTIEGQEKLTPQLKARIERTFDLTQLEDIYLPYKKKRLTRAAKARAKGLEGLAKLLLEQGNGNIEQAAKRFVKGEVVDTDDALQGAKDIIAEWINEDEKARNAVRRQFEHYAKGTAKLVKSKKEEAIKYKDYFEFEKALDRVQPHQLLAILRAEKEGFLKVNIEPEEYRPLESLDRMFLKGKNEAEDIVAEAITDAYKRLLKPSISTEFRNKAKEKADEHSINIFATNLRQLLLASPLGQKRILAIDPGFATGCKVVCLSDTGDLKEHTVIYPTAPRNKTAEAERIITRLVQKYDIEAIAIGNGTAGRETEAFIRGLKFKNKVDIFLVNESGASIYSASDIARKEFPDEDITVRGSVSIGRRLADPLAELVKIDPKSIGVGQYQHDVDQKKLQSKLDAVIESCVNVVGVDLNTASEHLLTYVSGLGYSIARNIVAYRKANGSFSSRKELLDVPRLGAKAYEQAAGFLRVKNAKNPLDNTAVHPESYPLVKQMAKDLKCKVEDLISNTELRKQIDLRTYTSEKVGLPTLQDIFNELEKPGRDPRATRQVFTFANISTIEELNSGMKLPGVVTNITAFGAFVDIGIKENGLIHKSKMSHKFVDDPATILKLGQELEVTVMEVDLARKRIQLSLVD
ncbi:MAG: Transcription accessory protein (S1 RNA-binding domain) [uncultured Aureispira sp.]|uniref:Transcription accessory protein (S1 RNA-binding domain) n=1 Tax=uncultured Aureispira sp. TaxID=1331704 RepID=A0A6S6S3R3_9BACT|nr:MAG: Transcription accessory protein (S1 RNA-binding domain) [uncultured Aureispira sp.]